jgi:5-methylcytosine-specific restriction endonuclease McrBC GTP-binding regulatory subunit McrB
VPDSSHAPLNQILYGPPGTGKTFRTVDRALQVLDPEFYDHNHANRVALKAKFDEFMEGGRIGFVTFHQSFSYEDFVEGLRASTNEEGQVTYEIEDGIFKRMCATASAQSAIEQSKPIDANANGINISVCWLSANVATAATLMVDAIAILAIIEPQ